MNLLNSVFVCAALFALQLCTCSARLREHDEDCNNYKASESCRPDLDLICLDNVCTCKEMAFYDTERKACIALIGESCTPETTSSYSYYGNNYGSSNYYPSISRCPRDAICEQKDPNKTPDLPDTLKNYEYMMSNGNVMPHRCLCKRGFYADEDSQGCYPALGHNEKCSEELAKNGSFCDEYAGLSCTSTGVCACNSTEHVFHDQRLKRCVTKTGGDCNSNTFCEKNSICSTTLELFKSRYGNSYGGPMQAYAKTAGSPRKREDLNRRSGKCTCLPGYTMNSEGRCVGSFSVACSLENPCNADKFLSCIDGLCQCQGGSHQAFSSTENSSCVLLPGAVCKNDTGPKCEENSDCNSQGHCECQKGFSESPSGKCMLGFENECTMQDNRPVHYSYKMMNQQKEVYSESCNYYQGLSCTGKKCECFDTQLKWDNKRRICTAGIGERCGSIAMMRTSEFDYQQEPFYPTAYLSRRYSPSVYINSYFVSCAEGLTCTKEHHEIEGWRVCEKK